MIQPFVTDISAREGYESITVAALLFSDFGELLFCLQLNLLFPLLFYCWWACWISFVSAKIIAFIMVHARLVLAAYRFIRPACAHRLFTPAWNANRALASINTRRPVRRAINQLVKADRYIDMRTVGRRSRHSNSLNPQCSLCTRTHHGLHARTRTAACAVCASGCLALLLVWWRRLDCWRLTVRLDLIEFLQPSKS